MLAFKNIYRRKKKYKNCKEKDLIQVIVLEGYYLIINNKINNKKINNEKNLINNNKDLLINQYY
jgi:hypothetical protein